MRASRLLSLLLLLQTRGRMTAQELAESLEVSVRTVYRDVEALGAAGVPLYADRGPTGGYELLDGYRTRLTGLTGDEAASLALAGMPGPAAELGLGAALAAAQLKLHAALPLALRDRIARVDERFHLDPAGWFREGEAVPHLAAVAEATWEARRIAVTYQRWDGSTNETTLEPLGLVLKTDAWYLIARGGTKLRTYRVARILALTPLDESFERPADFDLAAFWRDWSERFATVLYRAEAVVRFSPRAQELLFLLGPLPYRAALANATPPDVDGWIRTTLPIESFDHAETDLLRFGAGVEVLEPFALRARFLVAAEALVAHHRRA